MPNTKDAYRGSAHLSPEQMRNAAIIYQVGLQLGASPRDIQIALITAYTESKLRNVNYGDRDSLGLFQQRSAWASAGERMDPVASTRMFFLGGHQGQKGLFDFKNRDNMGMGEAAQAVQVSAFPDRYIHALPLIQNAWPDIQEISGTPVRDMDGDPYGTKRNQPRRDPRDPSVEAPEFKALAAPEFGALKAQVSPMVGAPQQDFTGAQTFIGPHTNKVFKDLLGEKGQFGKGVDGWRSAVVQTGLKFQGVPYVWGGSNPDGFDCSGLIQYLFAQQGIDLPRISYQQANYGDRVGLNKLRPGDLVAWDNSSRNNGADHIALYIGHGQILEAPRPGLSVRVRRLGEDEGAWGVHLNL